MGSGMSSWRSYACRPARFLLPCDSSGYGPVTTPGTYPHPSTCQLDLFDQATTGRYVFQCGLH